MRVIMAMQDNGESRWLRDVFKLGGYVVDRTSNNTPEEVDFFIKQSGNASYGLAVYDHRYLSGTSIDSVPARLSISPLSENFTGCSLRHISSEDDDNVILRKTALELGSVYGLSSQGVIRAGAFDINLLNNTVRVSGEPLPCRKQQFKILRTLAVTQKNPLSIGEIAEHVYDLNSNVKGAENNIFVQLNSINKKINAIAGRKFEIRSLGKGVGYSLLGQEVLNNDDGIKFGPVTFYRSSHKIECGDQSVLLRCKEADLLEALSSKRMLSHSFLQKELGDITFGALHQQVANLRSKIKSVSDDNYIKRIVDVGYQLCEEPVHVLGQSVVLSVELRSS